MIVDTHVHIDNFAVPEPERLLRDMDAHGVERTVLLAEEPAFLETDAARARQGNRDRLNRLMAWCAASGGRLLPVYYLNPIEPDAREQADRAVEAGCIGFKVICETFYPGDQRALPVYQHIADLGKAILFHAGILWDWGDNGRFNRPCNWECMLSVRGARFALAHIAWPWCDEAIALYGKFSAMAFHPRYAGQEMYIDMTPGTPKCYRQRTLNLLHDVQYPDMENRLLFGSDSFTGEFSARDVRQLADDDRAALEKAGFLPESAANILGRNALKFWGIE